MIRYQVRNEYGLADPELYGPAEEDDPEALLEGVAMAGLVGVLRQLGDLAEFAAEIFHDLHEDVMATASRGHGLMLRLQQLEAEFPAAEKAIISQTDHSNYLHDDGVGWHANLQLNQNLITIGDMPRFILDSYEECRGPPHLFTLDKFDVAGAGASLKRYSDPSFFKMGRTSDMLETDYLREMKPRKIKKKAVRGRTGETLESLLVANSESQITPSKDRASRKVPPRTTKLKSRHPRDSYDKTTRICREQLLEVISSQQKILSNYSASHYHENYRSTYSSETTSPFGELDNYKAPAQCSAKLELTKVVPMNESDSFVTASTPIKGPIFLGSDDGQFLATQHEHTVMDPICKGSLVDQNDISSTPERLQESTDFNSEEGNFASQSMLEEKLQSAVVPVNYDNDHCRLDDIASDQDNFVDAVYTELDGESDCDMKTKRDIGAKMEAIDHLSSGLSNPCNGKEPKEPTRPDSFLVSDSSPSAVSGIKDTDSDSDSCRQLSGDNWIDDKEPFNDVDLMDVSSSSSVTSDGNFETNNNLNGCQKNQDVSFRPSNDCHAVVAHSSDEQLSQTSSGLDGLVIRSSDYEKAYHSREHGQENVLDCKPTILGQPNDVSHDGGELKVPGAHDLLLRSTTLNPELSKEQSEECKSLDTGMPSSKLASLPDMDCVLHMNNLELGNVVFPEENNTSTTPTSLDPDGVHKHLGELDSGVAPIHSDTLNNPLYESDEDEIVEELHCLPDEDLYKHVAKDQDIVALEKGTSSIRLNAHREDPMHPAVVPMHLSNVQVIPRLTESVSTFQDSTEAHLNEMLELSPRALNDNAKTSLIEGPPASSTAPLLGTNDSFLEHCASVEPGKNVEHSEVLVDAEVAEESTTMLENDIIPCVEEHTDGAKYTEKADVLRVTNYIEENSSNDVPSQSSSPLREDMETAKATSENIVSLEESRGHIFKGSMLHTANHPQPIEIENSGETYSDADDIQYLPSLHLPEESICHEELPEENILNAEVPCQCDSDMVGEQPSEVNQDLVRELSAQDSFGTNPFVDPGYIVSSTDPSPSMSYRPCFSEGEQDFLSELLIDHGNTEAKENLYPLNGSLWETATPPDEAPLPSEFMTEQDFRSFCHEYHEMDFTAVTDGFGDKPSSECNDITNGCVVSVLDLPSSVSVLLAELDTEAVCSKPDSQLPGCPAGRNIPGDTSVPSSTREVPDGETPEADSDLRSHESFGKEKNPELGIPSVPLKSEQERHALPGVVSDSGTWLLDNEKIGGIYGSHSGNIVPVKEEQETCANLVPHAFINENLDELDGHLSNYLPVEPAVEGRSLDEMDVIPLSKPVLTQESDVHVLDRLDSQIVPSSSIGETLNDQDVSPLSIALEAGESEDHITGENDSQIGTSLVGKNIDELGAPPPSSAVLVEKEAEVCVSGELDSQIASCSLPNEKINERDCPPLSSKNIDELGAPPPSSIVLVEKEAEVCVLGELDSQIASCSLPNEKIEERDCPPLSGSVLVENKSDGHVSGDPDCQIAPYSSANYNIDVPGATASVETGWEACSSPELDNQISSYPLTDDKVGELDGTPSCNDQVEAENGSYCSPEFHFQTASYSSVNDKIDGPGAATSVSIEAELGWEACSSPELDCQIGMSQLSDDKVGELDGRPSCNVQVEADNGSYCPPEFYSQIAPGSSNSGALADTSISAPTSINDIEVEPGWEACSSPELDFRIAPCPSSDDKVGELDQLPSCNVQAESDDGSCWSSEFDSRIPTGSPNSGALAETSTTTSTSVMPSTEENYLVSPVLPWTEPFKNVSNEDPQKSPPLPPLQWRLGRPRLGLLSAKGHMPDPARRTAPVLSASSQDIGNSLGSLDGMAESIASVSSQDIKERHQNSVEDDNNQRIESGRPSTCPTVTDVARTEHDRSFAEACGNIKHQGHITSPPTESEEHPNDSGATDGMALDLLPFPMYEHGINQEGPQQHLLCSDISDITEHLSHTDPAASDKMVDDHSAAGGMHLNTISSSTPGNDFENGCYQQPQQGEVLSWTSDNEESSSASHEEKNLKDHSITSGSPSDTTKHKISGSLSEGHSQESHNIKEQDTVNLKDSLSGGPSPSAVSIVSEDYPHGDPNLERENIHLSNLWWPGDKNKYVGGVGEGTYVQAGQPPVMGWTIGPQMLHPNYGMSMEGRRFEPEVTDYPLIRKPISMRNIPRNPLVDAVAAHDRSTMRKVAELAPAADKTNPDGRNLWLEQIRNKTFDLKPVGSSKPTSMRAPARNLKVAAIIEKANAIRQAVGSDDEDEDDDNWSDT
ncbi:SCAR-like protein 1 [Brachypodium distachyon]|uniref:WH2 domain-containing protein n=1 Tax=Brachypodium distachyon TaxID=15368 RepID=A0A0Q3GPZ5_BRADI|nr:SCAR-like protein 1 [Brachypodium distachyon]KQK12485.1 hypothetical protein BRADI_1g04000v3 [Brachypodium distachyon]PNT73909.1 hypothetical protein BRADI_1g04000v3 [Brachypodium distachyon]|eukprot:XP_010227781.1 SCAR-like protein 1 [Brachypodium distachyon]